MSITLGTPVNSGNSTNSSSRTQSHTTNADSKCLVVIVTGYDNSATDSAVSSVTWNSLSLSVGRYYRSGSGFIAIYYLSKPTVSQTANIVVTMGGTCTDLQVTSVDLVSATASAILFNTYSELTLSSTYPTISVTNTLPNAISIGAVVALVSAVTSLSVTTGTEITGSEADMGSQCVSCAYNTGSSNIALQWSTGGAITIYMLACTFYEQFAPTTSLNSPSDAATSQSTTPVLKFTGTDSTSSNLEYQIELTQAVSTWTEETPAGSVNKNWQCFSIDFDGTNVRMLVGVYGGRLYYYNGTSWAEQTPAGGVDKDWQCGSIAFDGTSVRMIAGVYLGRLYYYNGTSWAEQTPAGDINTTWYSCSLTFDGTNTRILAGVFSGRLWYYNGTSWAEERPKGDTYEDWNCCSLAFDGTNLRMLAGAYSGRLYYYNGTSWAEQQPAGAVDKNWLSCSIAISGTNVRMIAGPNGRLYYYNGTSWAEQTPAGSVDQSWYGASIAFDGTSVRMFAVAYLDRAWYYNGSIWAEQQPAGNSNMAWYGCALAYDGTMAMLLTGVYGGRLYSKTEAFGISKLSSVPDAGFLDSPDEGDTHPFTSGTQVQFEVAIELLDGTASTGESSTYSTNTTCYGQSFTGISGKKLIGAEFYVSRIGNPTGTIRAVLYAHSGTFGSTSVGTGNLLAYSDTINCSDVPLSVKTKKYFTFQTQYTLSSGYYVIGLETPIPTASDNINIYRQSSTHAGNASVLSSGTWAPSSDDYPFHLYIEAPLLESTTYYWRVRAIAPTGSNTWGAWSSTWSFTTQGGNVSTITLGRAWMIIYGITFMVALGAGIFQHYLPEQPQIEEAEFEILI